jgi:hypothetical protein
MAVYRPHVQSFPSSAFALRSNPPSNSEITFGVGRFGEMPYWWIRGGVALTSLEVLSSVQAGGDNVRLRSFYPF